MIKKAATDLKKILEEDGDVLWNLKKWLISKSDQGHISIAMQKDECEVNLTIMLSDTKTYKQLSKDPTQKIQTKVNGKWMTFDLLYFWSIF